MYIKMKEAQHTSHLLNIISIFPCIPAFIQQLLKVHIMYVG